MILGGKLFSLPCDQGINNVSLTDQLNSVRTAMRVCNEDPIDEQGSMYSSAIEIGETGQA